jgi:hypothetical protein
MTPDELVSFVEWETEMARHFNEQMRRLNALFEHPHSNYPSVLAGLQECRIAIDLFGPCDWWNR